MPSFESLYIFFVITKPLLLLWISSIVSALSPFRLSSPSPQKWPCPPFLPISSLFWSLHPLHCSYHPINSNIFPLQPPPPFHVPSFFQSDHLTHLESYSPNQSFLVCVIPFSCLLLISPSFIKFLWMLLPPILQYWYHVSFAGHICFHTHKASALKQASK